MTYPSIKPRRIQLKGFRLQGAQQLDLGESCRIIVNLRLVIVSFAKAPAGSRSYGLLTGCLLGYMCCRCWLLNARTGDLDAECLVIISCLKPVRTTTDCMDKGQAFAAVR